MEKKKLSIKEQCERIKKIMANENMITCQDCNETYLPMTNEAEIICPICGVELKEELEEFNDYEDDFAEIY